MYEHEKKYFTKDWRKKLNNNKVNLKSNNNLSHHRIATTTRPPYQNKKTRYDIHYTLRSIRALVYILRVNRKR